MDPNPRTARSTRAIAGILLVVAAIVAAACEPPPPPQTVSPATGCHVGLLGDSLSVRVESRLPAALEKQGCTQVWVDAFVGRTTGQGVEGLRARVAAGELPAVLVVGLGTNDRFQQVGFASHVESIMELAAGRPVVWIEIAFDPVKENLNAILRRKASEHPNLSIMAWDTAYWANPEWRSSDDVHLTDLGADARAERIAVAAQRVAK